MQEKFEPQNINLSTVTKEELLGYEPTMDSSSDEYIQKLQLKSQEKDIEELKDKTIEDFLLEFSNEFEDCAGYIDTPASNVEAYLRFKLKEIL